MQRTPLQKRAERRSRNQTMVDMNLVSLIDVFTILIFFLLSNAGGVETLPHSKAVLLPESVSETTPHDTIVVTVSGTDILVDGRRVASSAQALAQEADVIEPLKTALDGLQSHSQNAKPENEAGARRLTIMGDKDIPYRLLRRIMVTSARANFSDVSFAVRQRFES